MGASKEDYDKVVPPKSVIHVDEFDSPKKLAEYLHKLDKNDTLYNEYFRWKGSGHFVNTKFMCRICAMLHDNSRRTWYQSVEQWWRGPNICIKPSAQNPWGSWKKANRKVQREFNAEASGLIVIPDNSSHRLTRHNCRPASPLLEQK